jgi:hypothetical protein
MSLTAEERELGLTEFHCDAHGFLAVTTPKASVFCRCGKIARRVRNGRLVDPDTLKPTAAKARSLNEAGHPNIHACGDCGADFGGKRAHQMHRVGRGSKKRCLTAEEMLAKGLQLNSRGRWVRQTPVISESRSRASGGQKSPRAGRRPSELSQSLAR